MCPCHRRVFLSRHAVSLQVSRASVCGLPSASLSRSSVRGAASKEKASHRIASQISMKAAATSEHERWTWWLDQQQLDEARRERLLGVWDHHHLKKAAASLSSAALLHRQFSIVDQPTVHECSKWRRRRGGWPVTLLLLLLRWLSMRREGKRGASMRLCAWAT